MLPEEVEQESTPEFDKLMAMFEPKFAAAPWEPGDLPPLGFGAMVELMRRTVSSRFATQAMEVIPDAGTDSGTVATAGPG